MLRADVPMGARSNPERFAQDLVVAIDQLVETSLAIGAPAPEAVLFNACYEHDLVPVAVAFHRRKPSFRFFVHYRYGMS